MFRLPHPAPLGSNSGSRQGITNGSPDSTTFWIDSKASPEATGSAPYTPPRGQNPEPLNLDLIQGFEFEDGALSGGDLREVEWRILF
jgi:hypothetical protein